MAPDESPETDPPEMPTVSEGRADAPDGRDADMPLHSVSDTGAGGGSAGEADRPTVPLAGAASQGPPMADIDDYQILARIGEGGMATVWKAIQLSTRREVALKLIGRGAFGSALAQLRFEREVELAARLAHPNIAEVYDSGLRKGLYYYAMRLIDGVRLDRHVTDAKLSQREIAALMRTICQAVQHAHQHGIIHRDLKPSNILVTPEGKPYVVDFGLAKTLDVDADSVTVSFEGSIAGTVAFMSPEQAAGQTDMIDTRSDVYSLGVILYRLLTGHSPHSLSGSRVEVLQRIATQDVRRPRGKDRTIDSELEAVLLKALAHDRDGRYASGGQLGDDLDNYLNGEPLTARKPTTLYFLSKRIRKHRVGLALAATILMAVIGATVFYIHTITTERDRTHRASLQAMAQRDLAEHNAVTAAEQRALALQTLNKLIFQVQKELDGQRAHLKLRQDLVDLAVAGLGELADAAFSSEASPDRSSAATLLQIGDILRDAGRKAPAREAYDKALARFAALGADEDVRSQRDLCVCRARLGTICLQMGDLPAAGEHCRAGLAIAHRLATTAPDDPAVVRDGWALTVLAGDVAMARSDFDQARVRFDRAGTLARRLPDTRDLSTTLRRLGGALLRLDRNGDAQAAYRQAVAIDRRRLSADPDSLAAKRHVAVGLGKLGEALFKADKTDTARANCQDALAIIEQLIEAEPDRFDTQGDLAATAYVLAQIEGKAGRVQAARAWYQRVVSTLEALEGEGKLDDQPRYRDLLAGARVALAAEKQ